MQTRSLCFVLCLGTIGLLLAATLTGGAGDAWAHGPQLQITNEGGKIVTRSVFVESPYDALSPPRKAYVMPVLEFNGSWYSRPNRTTNVLDLPTYFSGPGLAYGLGASFASGESFELAFLDGLLRWNGADFVDPGSEQLQAFRGTPEMPSAVAVTSDGGPFASLAFPTIAVGYNAEAHSSARFRLLGDGSDPLSASQDGVYLLTLAVTSSEAGLDDSDPFYFVLHKSSSAEEVSAAVGALGLAPALVQFVPEPSGIGFGVLGMVILAVSVWRRDWN